MSAKGCLRAVPGRCIKNLSIGDVVSFRGEDRRAEELLDFDGEAYVFLSGMDDWVLVADVIRDRTASGRKHNKVEWTTDVNTGDSIWYEGMYRRVEGFDDTMAFVDGCGWVAWGKIVAATPFLRVVN